MAKTLEQLQAETAELERQISLGKDRIQLLKAQREAEPDPAVVQAYNEEIARQRKLLNEFKEDLMVYTPALKAAEEQATRLAAAQKKLNEQFQAGKAQTEELFQSLLNTTGMAAKFTDAVGKAASEKGLGTFIKGSLSAQAALSVLESVGKKTIDIFEEFAVELDAVAAEFRAATGAGNDFNEQILEGSLANIRAGQTAKDAANSIQALKNEFLDFTYLNQDQQNEVVKTTTLLDKLGFSFAQQADILQMATQSLGMSVDESQQLLIDLASIARSLGQDISETGAAFNANRDFLVRFGEDAIDVFQDLSVTAKSLGTDLATLIEVTEQFKQFDSAANAVGRLNAILRGPFFNSIDMLNAAYEDPVEGIRMLREGFERAGVAAEDLSGAQLEAVASAMNLSTSKVKELLGATNEELDVMQQSQADVERTAIEAQKIMDQLANSFRQILVDFKPVIDNIIMPMMGLMSDFAVFLGEAENGLSKFLRVGTAVAGIAAVIAAPLALAAGVPVLAAGGGAAAVAAAVKGAAMTGLLTSLGVGAVGGAAAAAPSVLSSFNTGGTIMDPQAIVHKDEILITGGEGSEVMAQQDFKEMINGIKTLADAAGAGPGSISVYVGQEKIDELVLKGLNSEKARSAFSPYTNA